MLQVVLDLNIPEVFSFSICSSRGLFFQNIHISVHYIVGLVRTLTEHIPDKVGYFPVFIERL